MPTLPIRFALLEQFVDGGRTLLEPLLFPEMSRLGGGSEAAQKALIRNVEQLIKHSDPALVYRRRVADELLVDEITVTISPPKGDVAWSRDIKLTLPFVYWSTGEADPSSSNGEGTSSTLAYVPALAMNVISQGKQDIRRQVDHEIRSALARRRAETLASIAPLARYGALKVVRRDGEIEVMSTAKWSEYVERFGAPEEQSALKEVASNLLKSPLPPAYESAAEVERFARLLGAAKMPHVLLIGDSGVGKSALYYELARRRHDFDLAGREFWETSGARLVAGMSGFGMWQERCQRLLAETAKRNVILHLGNLVELMEVGKSVDSNQSIAAFLRNALYRGELTAVAECTETQLDVIERADPQLLAAFQPLRLHAPDSQTLQSILLSAAVEPPPERKKKKSRKRKTAKRDEERRIASMRPVSPEAIGLIERLHSRFATYSAAPGRPLRFLRNLLQSGPSYMPIDEPEVTRAFAKETGLPEFILDDQQPMRVAEVREWFANRIIGQTAAVDVIVNLLATIKAGLNRPTRPFASLIFVGPTGVGKTELAKALARFLYQDERRLVRFDMSEFADPVAVDRLIGGSFANEGLLTRKVREQPFTVVLLDEIEKAYSSFFDLLLQVLGEGRLTDSSGRVADFRNSVIIMTSNLGAEAFRGRRLGLADEANQAVDAESYFIRKVREFVRPELFNRIDRIVPFQALVGDEIRWIADREIDKLRKRDGIQYRDIELDFSIAAVEALANEGVEPTLGARPLKRVLERRVTAPLATKLNAHSANHGYTVRVDVDGDAVELTAKARPKQADRLGVNVHEAILALSKTRRRTQKLARGSAALRLQNEQFRLRQRREQLLRRTKRRPKANNPETSASDWVDFPDAGRLATLDAVIERYQRLEKEAAEFEEHAMVDYYSERPLEAGEIRLHANEFENEIQAILAKIFHLDSQRVSVVVVSVYSESKSRMLEMASAYEAYARSRDWFVHSCNIYRQYDPALDSESSQFNEEKYRQSQRPTRRLRASTEVEENDEEGKEENKAPKVLDVYRTPKFSQPSGNVIGLGLVLRGEAAHPLLEPEYGLHEFKDRNGRQESCVVETSAGPLGDYTPPLDVCRRSFLTRASRRRRYLFGDGIAEDALLKKNLKVDGATLKDIVKLAIDAYFTRQLERLLDE